MTKWSGFEIVQPIFPSLFSFPDLSRFSLKGGDSADRVMLNVRNSGRNRLMRCVTWLTKDEHRSHANTSHVAYQRVAPVTCQHEDVDGRGVVCHANTASLCHVLSESRTMTREGEKTNNEKKKKNQRQRSAKENAGR